MILTINRWVAPRGRRFGTSMLVIAVASLTLTACADERPGAADGRVAIVTSFYPIEEAATRIGSGEVTVVNLTPPGVEPHDLELTPDVVELIAAADLVLYLGGGFQPAVEDAVESAATGVDVDILGEIAASNAYELAADPEGELSIDPHLWLDPAGQSAIADVVRDALVEVAPDSADAFTAGYESYVAELAALEEGYGVLHECRQKLLVTGHEAFGYLARAYELEQVGVAGVSPETEPSPKRLADIAELVATEGVTTVYAEDLLPPDTVETIADATGASVAVLNTLESLATEQRDEGQDYRTLMEENLTTLVDGQDCG